MSGADRHVPGDENSDLHEGSTGVQVFSGVLDLLVAARRATIAARISNGEKRFTSGLYDRWVTLEIDHVICCVSDLDYAARSFGNAHDLHSIPGGRHPGHGTGNRIIPLGSAYLELVSVVDHVEAKDSVFGRWVAEHSAEKGIDALCLRTDDIDGIANRRDLPVSSMSRARPDGVNLHWRLAGLDEMLGEGLPFFIQWDVDAELMPGRSVVDPPNPTTGFEQVVISGRLDRLEPWIGDCEGLRLVEGEPGVVSVVVQSRELA